MARIEKVVDELQDLKEKKITPVLALGYWQKENKSKVMKLIKATKADW